MLLNFLNSDLDVALAKQGIKREEGHHLPGFPSAKRESKLMQEDDEFVWMNWLSYTLRVLVRVRTSLR